MSTAIFLLCFPIVCVLATPLLTVSPFCCSSNLYFGMRTESPRPLMVRPVAAACHCCLSLLLVAATSTSFTGVGDHSLALRGSAATTCRTCGTAVTTTTGCRTGAGAAMTAVLLANTPPETSPTAWYVWLCVYCSLSIFLCARALRAGCVAVIVRHAC